MPRRSDAVPGNQRERPAVPKGTDRRRGSAAALTKTKRGGPIRAALFRAYFPGIAAAKNVPALSSMAARTSPSSR